MKQFSPFFQYFGTYYFALLANLSIHVDLRCLGYGLKTFEIWSKKNRNRNNCLFCTLWILEYFSKLFWTFQCCKRSLLSHHSSNFLFLPNAPFWSENIRKLKVFWCFQGDRKGTLGRDELSFFPLFFNLNLGDDRWFKIRPFCNFITCWLGQKPSM